MKTLFACFFTFAFFALGSVLAYAAPLPENVSLVPTERPANAKEIRDAFAGFKTVVHEDEDPWDETTAKFKYGGKSYILSLFHGEGMEMLEITLEIKGHSYLVDDIGGSGTCYSVAGKEIPCEEIDGHPDSMWEGDTKVTDDELKNALSDEFAEAVNALLAYKK
jgi:hypothetical protein